MATAGDGVSTYQSGGAGGKFRKRPIRRSIQATPYDRPRTALRNNSPSLFAKLVDPASRLIYAGADRLFGVFRKRLPSIPAQRQPVTSEEPRNGSQEVVPNSVSKNSTGVVGPSPDEGGDLARISVASEISDLENVLKQKTFTRSEIERLTALLLSRTTESEVVEGDKEKLPSTPCNVPSPSAFTTGTLNKHVEERETGNFDVAILTPLANSRAFEDNGASPAELAKVYMETRPSKVSPLTMRPSSQSLRQDSVLLNNTTTFLKTPTTALSPTTGAPIKTFDNGLTNLRSRGRSALYNMPRTPYYRGPSTLSQKGVASPSAWEHEGSVGSSRMAAKHRSAVLDDIGSGGPMRRIRQKANLLSQQSSLSKSELASSQKLLLKNEPGPKVSKAAEVTQEISKQNQSCGSVRTESSQMALKIFEQLERMSPKEKMSGSKLAGTTEKVDSPKVLSGSQDNPKSEEQHYRLFPEARESTSQSKNTIEENGSRNIVGHSNVLRSVNKDFTVPVSGSASLVTKAGTTANRAFLMSAHEDSLELDDDNHSNGRVSVLLGENKKPGTSVLTGNAVTTGVPAEVIQTHALPKVGQTTIPEVDSISGVSESKKGAISSGGSAYSNQKMSFNFPASTSSSSIIRSSVFSQSTSVVDTVTSQHKSTVFPTFGTSTHNSAGTSAAEPSSSSDARPIGPTSSISSTMNNEQVQFPASNKDGNGSIQKPANLFGNSGSSSSVNLPAASASGIVSFGGATNNSGIVNGTSASSPSIFAASSSFQLSGTNTNKIFSSGSSFFISSATTAFLPSTTMTTTTSAAGNAFSTSMPASIFSSGSVTALASASMTPSSSFVTTSGNGGSIFGLSSPPATLTSNGFQAKTQAASTAVTPMAPFKFGSGTGGVPSSTPASSLFSSSAPSFGVASAVTTSEFKSGGLTSGSSANMFGSAFSSTPNFGLSATAPSSETKSGSSTGSSVTMFGSGFSSTPSFGLSSTVPLPEIKFGNSTSSSTASIFGSSTPSFGVSSTVALSETKSGSSTSSSTTNIFGSGFSSTPNFGLSSTVASSETKSGSSTSNIFGSTPFSFGASSASTPSAPSSPFMFGSSNAGASARSSLFSFSSNSSLPAPVLGNSTPVFGTSPTNNNDHMNMEDSMADDTNQTPTPSVPAFAQASSSGTPGFMFGSATPMTPSTVPFQFGGQINQQPPPLNSFPASGNSQFTAGGSFSLGSGGDDKSNRRIVKVKRQNRRK